MQISPPPKLNNPEVDAWLQQVYLAISNLPLIPYSISSGTSTGNPGTMTYTDDYLYICTDTDVWQELPFNSYGAGSYITETGIETLTNKTLKGINYNRSTVDSTNTPYTPLSTDLILAVDTTTSAVEIILPTNTSGRILIIKDEGGNSSTNNITISTPGAVTIDTNPNIIITGNHDCVCLYADGTNWEIH